MSPLHPEGGHYGTAEAIQAGHPNWLVTWGVFTHQYVAFPLFNAPAGSVIQSASPQGLLSRMRQAELALTAEAQRSQVFDPFRVARHHDGVEWPGGDGPNP